jgi:hypothetical protein
MAIMMFVRIFLAGSIICSHADQFLKATPQVLSERLSEESIRNTLLEEIEGSLGAGSAAKRLNLLEAILLPVYRALPKNENGKLEHSTVRYALHRLFVLRHGWRIRELQSGRANWNASSPAGVLKGQVPAYVQDLFEQRLGGKGLGLHELAVLAATIEHLVHNEIVGKLGIVFDALSFSPTAKLSQSQADEIFDTYMMGIILGRNLSALPVRKVKLLTSKMPEIFTGWSGAQGFVRRIRKDITDVDPSSTLDFAAMAKVAEVVGEEYGSFQNIECQDLKGTLMKIEDRGTGRVKLADFYKPALNGAWQFQESLGYLRQIGALDESNPTSISVIIPNYLHSQTNCLASSGFYSVCCKDECEGLLGHLEEKLGSPEAAPTAIAAIVAQLASSTISAPRQLSRTLQRRLDDIALEHGGTIPLHGRLFAQWLHHAYPRECPYPHISGTTSQQTADEWISESGASSEATEEEMLQFTTENATDYTLTQEPVEAEDLLSWSAEEELLVYRRAPHASGNGSSTHAALRNLAYVAAVLSFACGLVKSLQAGAVGNTNVDNMKFVV